MTRKPATEDHARALFVRPLNDLRPSEARDAVPRQGRGRDVLAGLACLLLASGRELHAAEAETFSIKMPDGPVVVDSVAAGTSGPCPAVVVLSGSKGFGSFAYTEMSETFTRLGLDVFRLHVLSTADIDAIARAGSTQARIAYEGKRLPRWTAAVGALVDRLDADSRHAGRVGLIGISLGAQIAAAATAEHGGVRALILVDGGFPGRSASSRTLPSIRLIWGSADRVFPVAVAQERLAASRDSRGTATLKVYEGGSHDFFLQPGSPQAEAAHQDAAEFFATHLD